MPAVARTSNGDLIIGVGGEHGVLEARRASDGSLRWKRTLVEGRSVSGGSVLNALSSVAACDIDGDGQTDFLVGDSDGYLYAFRAADGAQVWSLRIGSAIGDPIVADVDGDGKSEILAPAADGYLYAIGAPR